MLATEWITMYVLMVLDFFPVRSTPPSSSALLHALRKLTEVGGVSQVSQSPF